MRSLGQGRQLLELIRFSHTVFALPFALAAALLAWQEPGVWFRGSDLLAVVLCMVFARSSAMAFNRLVDRKLDALNPRTASRHLPTQALTPRAVGLFAVGCGMAFVGSAAIFELSGNPWPLLLALPVLAWLWCYSYAKRFTLLCHLWLGASLMLAPIAAWIALCGMRALATPMLLGGAVLFWVAGFDVIYACQDVQFDRAQGLRSIPAAIGVRKALWVAGAAHALSVVCLVGVMAVSAQLGAVYLSGVALIALLLVYEHSLVSSHDLSRTNRAFFGVNAVVSLGLLLTVALQLVFNRIV